MSIAWMIENWRSAIPGWGVNLVCLTLCLVPVHAYAGNGTVPSEGAQELDTRGFDLLPDGTLALQSGTELVLSGLDVALGLAPAGKPYTAALRRLSLEGNWILPDQLDQWNKDRYGRIAGQVQTGQGTWVQLQLIRHGLARYAGGVSDQENVEALLNAENQARRERLGIWRLRRFAVQDAAQPDGIFDGFQIVEGTVAAVGRGDGIAYLNFGADWHDDFTAGIVARLDQFIGPDGEVIPTIQDLTGLRIRLRGIVRRYNGPFMHIAAKDQIEILPMPGTEPIRLQSSDPWGLRPASGSTL